MLEGRETVLAIDTSAGQCAVAVVGAGTVERSQPMTRGHAEALFPMIDDALAVAGAAYADLSRIAVCTGPGSFTGLRIGISAARGLALGLGIPCIGVSRFDALVPEGFTGTLHLAARGGMIWAQDFDGGQPTGDPRQETGEVEDPLPDPIRIAALAADRTPGPRPAPLYLRGADAALPGTPPPTLLD